MYINFGPRVCNTEIFKPPIQCTSTSVLFMVLQSPAKQYKSDKEEEIRKSVFQQNLKQIEVHNALADSGTYSYRLGINQFADMVSRCLILDKDRTLYLLSTCDLAI